MTLRMSDGGKTGETNWTTDYERVSSASKGVWNASDPPDAESHGFDFLLGSWKTHDMRLKHPLTGDRASYKCEGTSSVRPFWGGSADLEDGDLRCPRNTLAVRPCGYLRRRNSSGRSIGGRKRTAWRRGFRRSAALMPTASVTSSRPTRTMASRSSFDTDGLRV